MRFKTIVSGGKCRSLTCLIIFEFLLLFSFDILWQSSLRDLSILLLWDHVIIIWHLNVGLSLLLELLYLCHLEMCLVGYEICLIQSTNALDLFTKHICWRHLLLWWKKWLVSMTLNVERIAARYLLLRVLVGVVCGLILRAKHLIVVHMRYPHVLLRRCLFRYTLTRTTLILSLILY